MHDPQRLHSPRESNLDNVWAETLIDLGYVGTSALAVLIAGLSAIARRRIGVSRGSRLFLLLATSYMLAATFMNPSIQSANTSQVLLGFLLVSAAAQRPWCRSRRWRSPEVGPRSDARREAAVHSCCISATRTQVLWSDGPAAIAMGARGRDDVRERHSHAANATGLLAIVDSLGGRR